MFKTKEGGFSYLYVNVVRYVKSFKSRLEQMDHARNMHLSLITELKSTVVLSALAQYMASKNCLGNGNGGGH